MSDLSTRSIGDLTVSAIGFGCMQLSDPRMIDKREQSIGTIHAALDAGVTFLDTADIYAPTWDTVGHNEILVAEALRSWTGNQSTVTITTKGGITRSAGERWGRDASYDHLARAAEASCARLGVESIDLWQFHRLDPSLTVEDQFENVARMRELGLIKRLGLSNVTADQLSCALAILGGPDVNGVVSVQNERSPRYRRDSDVLAMCGERGIAYLPWSPLGGLAQAHDIGDLYTEFSLVAQEIGASPQQVVLAWMLAESPVVIHIVGASRPETILNSVGALEFALSDSQLDRLNATIPLDSSMYPDDQPHPPFRR